MEIGASSPQEYNLCFDSFGYLVLRPGNTRLLYALLYNLLSAMLSLQTTWRHTGKSRDLLDACTEDHSWVRSPSTSRRLKSSKKPSIPSLCTSRKGKTQTKQKTDRRTQVIDPITTKQARHARGLKKDNKDDKTKQPKVAHKEFRNRGRF